MTEQDPSPQIKVQHFGAHHQAHLLLKPGERKVSGGTILNFSDHAALNLQLNGESKASAVLGHSGKTHVLQIVADTDGNFEGTFEDTRAGVTLKLSANTVELKQGRLPEGGITSQGDHHTTSLTLDAEGKISGILESKNTQGADFRLEVEAGKIKAGSFVHKGGSHESRITLGKEGWSASVGADKGDRQWVISVDKGQAGLSASGQIRFDF